MPKKTHFLDYYYFLQSETLEEYKIDKIVQREQELYKETGQHFSTNVHRGVNPFIPDTEAQEFLNKLQYDFCNITNIIHLRETSLIKASKVIQKIIEDNELIIYDEEFLLIETCTPELNSDDKFPKGKYRCYIDGNREKYLNNENVESLFKILNKEKFDMLCNAALSVKPLNWYKFLFLDGYNHYWNRNGL